MGLPGTARYGTLCCDLLITAIVAIFAYRARFPAQQDLAFASTLTAMLLVSPVSWDASLPLLLVPIAVAGATPAVCVGCRLHSFWS